MKKKKKKNIKQRFIFKNLEKKKLILKILLKNLNIKNNLRFKIQQKLNFFSQQSSITCIKNICILTGRSKSIYRLFKISRIQLKNLVSKGYLSGVLKYNF
jgi:small subunit ribosomal protein S14